MTHYEQCCARECPDGCGKGCKVIEASLLKEGPVRMHFCSDFPRYVAGISPYHDPIRCTAPTLAQFAERCAEALADVDYLAKKLGTVEALTFGQIARRALGFGGLTCVKKQ